MFSDIGDAIDISFSGENGGDSVGLESSFEMNKESSVTEEATLDAPSVILEDAHRISVLGDASAAHSYWSSSGHNCIATITASQASGGLTDCAYLTANGIYATHHTGLSGALVGTGMAMNNQGIAARIEITVTDGSLNSYLGSYAGSVNVAGLFSASGGSIQVYGSTGDGKEYGLAASKISPVNGAPASYDGPIFAHNRLGHLGPCNHGNQ
ncbi:MAG: hypothetical protein EHM14_14330 [Methanothrix sp.]|nr:MAG: hypothetical protein EHM14_14330 [Methanothrix sp.]